MKKALFLILISLFCINFYNEVLADSIPSPYHYKNVTGDGRYVFVMIVDDLPFDRPSSSTGKRYPVSGLYHNDGSISPIWKIDWYAFEVYVSTDGRHIARIGDWPNLKDKGEPNLEDLALAFYGDGKLIKQYLISDLVRNSDRLPRSLSHFYWKKNIVFDDAHDRLNIVTFDEQKYIFDVKSGEIIRETKKRTNRLKQR
ncbi:MAG: hypothetical protein NT066_06125 [Candidatus Omnitrophica bacterium]|nr:hypothetical protein [Candidatus Omnitrophota bacterium]